MNDGTTQHKSDIKTEDDRTNRWKREIDASKAYFKSWHEKVEQVICTLRNENVTEFNLGGFNKTDFNILYANHKLTMAAIYQQTPKPDIRRRHMDRDPMGKLGSEVIERALNYCLESYDFDHEMLKAIQDYDLGGRGVLRLRYEPDVLELESIDSETGEKRKYEKLVDENLALEYVYWRDFLHEPARQWRDVGWVAFRHMMTKEEVRPLNTKGVRLDFKQEEIGVKDEKLGEGKPIFGKAEVWEIWDKDERKVVWFSYDAGDVLSEEEDPLGFIDFYPLAEPLYGNLTNDTLIPVPEYEAYRQQAKELNKVTKKIHEMIDMVKIAGLTAGENEENIYKLFECDNGDILPLRNVPALINGAGFDSVLWLLPLQDILTAIRELYEAREQIKNTIYEIIGLSDLLRGVSDPVETATSQRIKGQFGSLRLDVRKRAVERFARDNMRLKAEYISEHFQPQTLAMMVNAQEDSNFQDKAQGPNGQVVKQFNPQKFMAVFELLRNDASRRYKIDVETDSTIAPDAEAEKEAATQLLTGVTELVAGMAPLVQSGSIDERTVIEFVRFAIKPFKGARNLENLLDEAEGELQQQREQGGGQKQKDPQAQLLELEQKKMEMQAQLQMVKAQLEQSKVQLDAQKKEHDAFLDSSKREMEINADAQRHEWKMDEEAQVHINRMLALELEHNKLVNTGVKENIQIDSLQMKSDIAVDAAERKARASQQNGASPNG